MFDLYPSEIQGCYEIQPRVLEDNRGRFVKVFHEDIFIKHGLETTFREEYYSYSHKNVLRGLHFQTPPHDHVKIVYCAFGEVFDAVLDLRLESPTFGMTATYSLSAARGNFLYIPKGLAHGFCCKSELSIMVYKVSTTYVPHSDSGVLWSSVGIAWPCSTPIISDRDKSFLPFDQFNSPFRCG